MGRAKGEELRIAIIGAGPGGLCMGIRLAGAGLDGFEILEKASGVGGTWHHNRYPGCACDVPSALYSFSFPFEPRHDWSRPYAPRPEILEYLEHCADAYGLRSRCRLGDAVERACWDEAAAQWTLELVTDPIARITPGGIVTCDGVERRVDTLILATGFETTKFLSTVDVIGRDGLSLAEASRDGARACKGITMSGFPNLFMLYGPNTNADSIITMIEYQADHVLRQIQRIVAEDLAWIDAKPGPMAAYDDEIQRELESFALWHSGSNDYGSGPGPGPGGRIVTRWPRSMPAMEQTLASLDEEAYEVRRMDALNRPA